MATCEFSEFSFGYAITDSLVSAFKSALGVAPVFANQIAEGKPGGGYDMKLPLNPLPMFFQFKIPQVLTRNTSGKPSGYWAPYYRMHLRTKKPNQHDLLLDLEAKHSLVYYATPLFDRIEDLDTGFMSKGVHKRSALIKPSRIGPLDDKPHYVSYKPGAASYWAHSEPREIGEGHGFDDLVQDMRIQAAGARDIQVSRTHEEGNVWTAQNRRTLGEIRSWLIEGRTRDRYPRRESDETLVKLLSKEAATPSDSARDLGYTSQIHYGLTLAFADADRVD